MASGEGKSQDEEDDSWLPEKPEKPLPSDCCGSGCIPCVMDIYEEDMAQWMKLKSLTPLERKALHEELECKKKNNKHDIPALSPGRFISLEIESLVRETKDSFIYRFKLPEKQSLKLSVGQHVVSRVFDECGVPITRQYTPISTLSQKSWFEVLIKLYANGKMSHEVSKWVVGTKVEWKGPYGGFNYKVNKFKKLIMLACGTGIAPMINLIREVLNNEEDETYLHILYACRTQNDIFLKDTIDEFKMYWNFSVVYFLSQCSEDDVQLSKGRLKYGDNVCYSRITDETLWRHLPVDSHSNCVVLVCGTRIFNKDMIKLLISRGFNKDKYFVF